MPGSPSLAPPTVDIFDGGLGLFSPPGLPSAHAGAVVDMVSNAAEVTNKAVFFTAGTDENVQGPAVEVAAEVA
ncbi:hypothetical protein GCM10009837_69580 [Streptomyces durmitorensis]